VTIPFSTLRRRVDVEDNGKFNYHLSKLVPHFVRQTDDGYRLSGAGKRIARTVIAVSGSEDVDFSAELERSCPLCDSPMTAVYEDQWLRVRCTRCRGLFGDEAPEGTVYLANYPATGLADRDADEALETGLYRCLLDLAYMMHGICRECTGSMAGSVSVCAEHDVGTDGYCDHCGTPFRAWGEHRCEACGFAKRLPVELFVMGLSPVIGHLDRSGVDALAPSFDELVDLLETRFETTVRSDPFEVAVSVDGMTVTLDEGMAVLRIDRPSDR
jgi:hypothetical protein